MDPSADASLLSGLDLSQINCLNENRVHTLKSILPLSRPSDYLLSDVDEQLLLNIPFNQTVRIRSISLKTSNVSQGPLKIGLLINRPSLGFEDVEDAEFIQEIEVTEQQLRGGERIPLKYVKFQSVNSLHTFLSHPIKEAKLKPESTHSTASVLEFMGELET